MTEHGRGNPIEDRPNQRINTEVYNPEIIPWRYIRKPIEDIDKVAIPKISFGSTLLKTMFVDPKNTVILLRSSQKIIGYAVAKPIGEIDRNRTEENAETAYVSITALHPNFQRQRLVHPLLDALDEELQRRGYRYVERAARIAFGYARTLEEKYRDFIVNTKTEKHPYLKEPMLYMRIRLPN